jgi:penicillin-binding protein 2
MTVDNNEGKTVKQGLQMWHDYYTSFAYGRQTGIDIPYEGKGLVPDTTLYNKMYNRSWNSCTIVFVGMGQGELLLTPLQMANGMCIIANKGYYYTPHFVKSIGKNEKDTLLRKYQEKHVVLNIPDTTFTIVQQAMQDVVDHGTAGGAKIEGITVCAKTGTAENKAVVNGEVIKMQNHSMFVAFAPRENPRIAIAVAIENSGYGATWAAPIASLVMEKYLKDSVTYKRKAVEDKMMNAKLINRYVYTIDSVIRLRDQMVYEAKVERKRVKDSINNAENVALYNKWINYKLKNKKRN